MKELRKKLKDQSGASILLALLFFLLCSMVGASVLTAAVSNAGKARGNREEQQKYLLLSSALRLVCDELTSAKYYGQYTYTISEPEPKREPDGTPITGEDGAQIMEQFHEYKRVEGDFQCGLKDVLPLAGELNLIFAEKFPSGINNDKSWYDGDNYIMHYYTYKPDKGTLTSEIHELTLSVDTDEIEGLDGSESEVTVKVQMEQDLHIWLTATLEADSYVYTMKALLGLSGEWKSDKWKFDEAVGSATGVVNRAEPVEWTLEWIAKKEAGDDT